VTIQLPPNLYDDSDWMGLALCAAVSVLKHPTLIRRNLDSGVSHQLACLWDTGCVEPPHVFDITEEKFTWLYLRGFIWVSYIPRKLWSEDLNLCSSIKATIGQSLKEKEKAAVGHLPEEKKNGNNWMVEKCGLRLVYKRDMQELQETIIKCVTSPFENNVEYIHQLIQDETRNTEQTTQAGSSYRDPYPERLRTPIYQGQSRGSGISFKEQHRDVDQLRRSLPVINYVDLLINTIKLLALSLSLLLDTIFLFYRSLIDALYIILASLQLKSRNGSAITEMRTT
jgi:hypothetical protein